MLKNMVVERASGDDGWISISTRLTFLLGHFRTVTPVATRGSTLKTTLKLVPPIDPSEYLKEQLVL